MILTIPGLLPGQTYTVQVRMKTDETTSEWSPSFTFDTDGTGPLPETPADPVWEVSGDAFYGEWDRVETDVDGATAVINRYEMELSVGPSVRIISVPQSTADRIGYTLTFADNVATFGTPQPSIGMRVRAINSIGIGSAWTTLINATNPAPPALSAIDIEPLVDAVNVSWPLSTAEDVLRYELQWSDSASGPWTTVYTGIQNAYVHPNVMWNDDSFYRVAVIDKFNTSSTFVTSGAVRPNSAFGADTTPPDNPTSITVTPGFDVMTQNAYIDVAWTSSVSTDVGNYVVRYSLDNSTWQYMTVDGDRTGARINSLVPGTAYYVSVRAKDTSGNVAIAWSNAGTYPVTTTNDASAPSQPSAPTAAVGTDRIQVSIDGLKAAGGAMESDVVHYQVHASTSSGFSLTNSTQLGIIQNGPAVVGTFHIPASAGSGSTETWYVKVRAVDRAGNISTASAQVSANVNLIQTANIGDAQITNAKINDLAANKITAGTGIINDLTVKSKLTLGDASTVGTIESYDYTASSGATGFTMSKNGLIIKSGSIEAGAINIAMGENIVRPEYASFEWSDYSGRLSSTGMISGVNTGAAFNGNRYLATVWGAAVADPTIYLGSSATDYNQTLVVGQKYIISAYARVSGAVGTTVRLKMKDSTGAIVTVGTVTPTTGSSLWTRVSGVYTATTATALVFFDSPTWTASAGFDVDGIQIERVYGSMTTPTQWRPPGITQIDGGTIRTGTISSTQTAVDIEGNTIAGVPAWSINVGGNAQFGNVNVRGRIIMGDSNDPAVDPVTGEETTLVGLSAMQSYNYVPGFTGWAIKGNGVGEFRQLAADSIDGSAIVAGTLSADKISSGEVTADLLLSSAITAQESQEFLATEASLTSNVATITTFDTGGLAIGDRIVVSLDSTDTDYNAAYDTPPGEYDIVTAVTSTTVSYARTNANIASATIGGTVTSVGKMVVIDGSGVTLFEADGVTRSVILPTDSDQDAYFSGAISASELSVDDFFSLHGTNNLIGSGSTLTLRSSMSPPPAPKAETNYENNGTWINSSNDDYFTKVRGVFVEGTTVRVPYDFFGANLMSYSLSTGAFVSNAPLVASGTTSDFTPTGITKIGSTYYVLQRSYATGIWYVYGGTSLTGAMTQRFSYDESAHSSFGVTTTQWRNETYLKEPTIGTDGTNLFIVRANKAGYPVVSSYNTTGTRLTINRCDFIANEHMRGMNVGPFDYSGTQWVISTPTKNYVTSTGGLLASDKVFPAPGGVTQVGVAWDSGSNRFCTFSFNGYKHYWFTDVAHQTANVDKWTIYQTWRDQVNRTFNVSNKFADGTTATITISGTFSGLVVGDEIRITGVDAALNGLRTVTAITSNTVQFLVAASVPSASSTGTVGTDKHETQKSPGRSFTVARRSRVKISSSVNIPSGTGDNDIHGTGFFISVNGGSQLNQGDLANGVSEITMIHQPASVSGSTYTSFPNGIPGKITSDDGTMIALRGDGSWSLGNISGDTTGKTNLYRFNSRGTSTSQPTATGTATNIVTATLSNPINGRVYRISVTGDCENGTAGGLTTLVVRHGIGAIAGGTDAGRWFVDHRVANRTAGFSYWTEFTYTGTSGITNYNVVLVFTGTGGTSTIRGDLSTTRIVAEEIL